MTGANPYVPHDGAERRAMLDAVGAASVEDLFDVPDALAFDGEFGIPARDERTVRRQVRDTLARNADLASFLGRGHYDRYVPAAVPELADRPEFLTSYTQYQPEVAQGFLQALFEYQSLLVELTGLGVANASMYDAASALGEAALLADRVRGTDGDCVLVPDHLRDERRAVLETYLAGPDLSAVSYPMADGAADVDALADRCAEVDPVLVYAETPTARGVVEESLSAVGDVARDAGALFCVGSDPIALSLLERPADAGADVVVGDASVLGISAAYGTGLGLFAAREDHLRQMPGRLVGASEDAAGRRAYTLTLQTREQHIRRERATSNICTNQAHLALRAAVHAAWLGPDGLVDRAEECVTDARGLAARLDAVAGVDAPLHDRHHFREFVAATERDPADVADGLLERGYAVHALADGIQVCATGTTAEEREGLAAALGEVA